MKLLHIDSSILGENSVSRTLTAEIVARLTALHPDAEVVYRDLTAESALHLSSGHLAVRFGAQAEAPDLAKDLEKAERDIQDLIGADTIVIGAEDKDETAYGTHGAAYVYRTSDGGATYSQMDKLAGSDDNGSFGASVAIDGSTVLVGESNGEDPDGVVFDGSRARSGVVHVFSSDASLWSSGALDSQGSSSGGSSSGSDSNTGAIVAGCVFGAFALLFVGAVAYFYRLSPEEQAAAKEKFWAAEAEGEKKFWAAEAEGEKQVAAAKEKFWAAEAEGEKQVKALFAKAEAEGEPEAAAEEAAP